MYPLDSDVVTTQDNYKREQTKFGNTNWDPMQYIDPVPQMHFIQP